jgi:hypothetical protein
MSDEQIDGQDEWEMREINEYVRRIAQGLKFMGEVDLAYRAELAATRYERSIEAETKEERDMALKQASAIVRNSLSRAVEAFEKIYGKAGDEQ